MAATYEELIAKSRELNAAGDVDGAKRVARIAISRRDGAVQPTPPSSPVPMQTGQITPEQRAANVQANAGRQSQIDAQAMPPTQPKQPDDQGAFAAFAGNLLPGMTFGAADEIGAGLTAAFTDLTYDQMLTALRAQQDKQMADHPVASIAGQVVGGAAVPGLAGGSAVSATRTLPQMALRGAEFGAGAGAVQGFMDGRDGLENRTKNAGISLLLGGTLGSAVPLVGAAAKSAVRGASDLWNNSQVGSQIGKELGVGNKTGRILANVIGSDDAAAMNAALNRAGPNAMLADASPQATGMLDMAMRSPIPAARSAGQAVEARASGAYDDITKALDTSMGGAVGLNSAQSGIRAETAANRGWLYDQAFQNEIDWRSPAGAELRSLLKSTPDDVLALAAKNQKMKARTPFVPDSAYADEFADSVSSKPGPLSGDIAGRQDVDGFFSEYDRLSGGARFKRPVSHTLKKLGGIDPRSPAAQDLYAQGITPKTAPGLFRNGGMGDVDNLDPSKFPDTMAGDGTGNYADRQGVIDAIVAEARGEPLLGAGEYLDSAAFAEMDRLLPEYEAKRVALAKADRAMAAGPTAPPVRDDIVPMKSVYDVDQIKRTLDEVNRTNDGKGLMGGQTEYGVEAGKRAREIRDLLAEISPQYKDALAAGTDTISRVKGVEFGSTILRPQTTREIVADMVKGATGGELKAVRQGIRSQIDETLANVRAVASDQNIDARAASKAFSDLSSPAAREKMAMVLGDDWEPLRVQLDQAGAALGLRARTSANSATFGRGASEELIKDEVAPNIFQTGNPFRSAADIGKMLTGASPTAIRRISNDVKGEIASILTRQGNGAPQQAVSAIVNALSKNPINTDAGKGVRRVIEALLLGNTGAASSGLQAQLLPQPRNR